MRAGERFESGGAGSRHASRVRMRRQIGSGMLVTTIPAIFKTTEYMLNRYSFGGVCLQIKNTLRSIGLH